MIPTSLSLEKNADVGINLSNNGERGKIVKKKTGSTTPEHLWSWYKNGGKEIVELCKLSDAPEVEWRIQVSKYNLEHEAKGGGKWIPTSMQGIMYCFGMETCSFYILAVLLSGRTPSEEEIQASSRKFRATKTQLISWYNSGGREIIQSLRESGSFVKSWRKYVDRFNKSEFYDLGFRLPNNIVGLVRDLGGEKYEVAEMVRLFEGWPEGTEVPKIKRDTQSKVAEVVPRAKAIPKVAVLETKQVEIIKVDVVKEKVVQAVGDNLQKPASVALAIDEVQPLFGNSDEREETSTWMVDFSKRFSNLFLFQMNWKYYLPLRFFIQALEREYPALEPIDARHMKVAVDRQKIMNIAITKAYIEMNPYYNFEHIEGIFYEVQEKYLTHCEQYGIPEFNVIKMTLRAEVS